MTQIQYQGRILAERIDALEGALSGLRQLAEAQSDLINHLIEQQNAGAEVLADVAGITPTEQDVTLPRTGYAAHVTVTPADGEGGE